MCHIFSKKQGTECMYPLNVHGALVQILLQVTWMTEELEMAGSRTMQSLSKKEDYWVW